MNTSCYIVALIEEGVGGYEPRFVGAGLFSEATPTIRRNGRFLLATIHEAEGADYEAARLAALEWRQRFAPWLRLDTSR